MKKIVLVVLLISVGIIANSQAKVEVGVKGGLNLASLSQDKATGVDLSSKTGYHFGAYGLVKVAMLGIQPEILYSTKGTDVSVSGVANDFSQEFVYLDIPIIVKYYLVAGLNLQAGPQFGKLLSVNGKYYDGTNTAKLSKSSFEDSDLSVALGAGFDAPFGLNIAARYVIGVSDTSVGAGDSKNRTFQLSIGYSLIKVGR